MLAPNPGPMTLAGTNTYVVRAEDGTYVIDPGPAVDDHVDAIRVAAGAGEIGGVLLTHGHSDHSDAIDALGAPVLWGSAGAGDEAAALSAALSAAPGEALRALAAPETDPELRRVAGFTVLPSPGHAADHVCFVRGAVCFCGDLILGEGSTIVPPRAGGGSLIDYMRSLERVAELDASLLAPGHGPWITEPAARIAEYIEHRRSRERRLVAALDSGERSRAALLAAVWDDVPEPLLPAAAIAMRAHLEKLAAEGHKLGGLTD